MFWYQFEQRQAVSLPLMAVISFKAMGRLGVKNDKKNVIIHTHSNVDLYN